MSYDNRIHKLDSFGSERQTACGIKLPKTGITMVWSWGGVTCEECNVNKAVLRVQDDTSARS